MNTLSTHHYHNTTTTGLTSGNCPADHYFEQVCDGTSTFDTACAPCTAVGNCPAGQYHDAGPTLCDGTGTTDERCVACTPLGACAVGEYADTTKVSQSVGEVTACHSWLNDRAMRWMGAE